MVIALVVGDACEVKNPIMWTGCAVQYRWSAGYVVHEVAPVIGGKAHAELIRVREVARGHLVNMPVSYVRAPNSGPIFEDA